MTSRKIPLATPTQSAGAPWKILRKRQQTRDGLRALRLDASMPIDHTETSINGIPMVSLAQLERLSVAGDYPPGMAARVQHYVEQSLAQSSRASLHSWWGLASALCDRWAVPLFPTTPQVASALIAMMADAGYSYGSVLWMGRTLRTAHRLGGAPDPTEAQLYRSTLKGIGREIGTKPTHRKEALLLDEVRAIADCAYEKHTARALYELTIILTAWHGALRRNEVARLDREHVLEGGQRLYIATSKVDQEWRGDSVVLEPFPEPRLCPVRALQRWCAALPYDRGPLFPALSACGNLMGPRVSAPTVGRIVKASVAQLGLSAEDFGAHSLRAGWITTALLQGTPDAIVAAHARDADVNSILGYFRPRTEISNCAQAFAERGR